VLRRRRAAPRRANGSNAAFCGGCHARRLLQRLQAPLPRALHAHDSHLRAPRARAPRDSRLRHTRGPASRDAPRPALAARLAARRGSRGSCDSIGRRGIGRRGSSSSSSALVPLLSAAAPRARGSQRGACLARSSGFVRSPGFVRRRGCREPTCTVCEISEGSHSCPPRRVTPRPALHAGRAGGRGGRGRRAWQRTSGESGRSEKHWEPLFIQAGGASHVGAALASHALADARSRRLVSSVCPPPPRLTPPPRAPPHVHTRAGWGGY